MIELLHEHATIVTLRRVRTMIELVVDRQRRRAHFRVGRDRYRRLLIVRYRRRDARAWLIRVGEIAESRLDLLLQDLWIEIPYRDDRHEVRAIPVLVKAIEGVALRSLENLRQSDGKALPIARALEDDRKLLVLYARGGAAPKPPFFQHDAALLFDLAGIEGDVPRPIAHDIQALEQDLSIVGRHGQLIDCFVERRIRVDVGAERHSDPLDVVD